MGNINTYTLKQYKACYADLLERHKLEYEDHNEFTFINTELENFYDGLIDIDGIDDLPFQFQFLKSFTNEELSEALVNQREFKNFAEKSNLSSSMIIDFLESRLHELEKESIEALKHEVLDYKTKPDQYSEEVKLDDSKQQHPEFDPNLWNNDCFELFKYLYDCYYKSTNRQLTNIWFYLKESGNKKYVLKATKDLYKDFILKNYQIKISNFDKAQTKWEDKEYDTIDDHRINFENAKNT